MYCLIPEKPLRLAPQGHFLRGVYGTFYLAISVTFNVCKLSFFPTIFSIMVMPEKQKFTIILFRFLYYKKKMIIIVG